MSKVVDLKYGEVLLITEIFQKLSKESLSFSTFSTIEHLLSKLLVLRKSIEVERDRVLDLHNDEILYYKRNSIQEEFYPISKEEFEAGNEVDLYAQRKIIKESEKQQLAESQFNEFLNSEIKIEVSKTFKEEEISDIKLTYEEYYIFKKFLS